jgi:hypothetical protein
MSDMDVHESGTQAVEPREVPLPERLAATHRWRGRAYGSLLVGGIVAAELAWLAGIAYVAYRLLA